MRPGSGISRRRFLHATTFSASMLALSRVQVGRAIAAETAAAPSTGLRVLPARDAEILTAIAERIVDSGDASMPPLRDTAAIATIDTALVQLDAAVRDQLRWALLLFEYGPVLFDWRFSRFTSLSPEARDAHLRGWAESRFDTRRLAFRAVRNLSFLGYYADDRTWPGIHYDGPWAPRPRRVVPV